MSNEKESTKGDGSDAEIEQDAAAETGRPDASADGEDHSIDPKPDPRKRKRLMLIGGIVLLIAAVSGIAYWLYARQFESTDDAFIDGDVVQVSPKVAAYVTKVYHDSNDRVKKGELLVELNSADYEVKLEQAKAQLQTAQSEYQKAVANTNLTKKTTTAALTQARSNVSTANNTVEQTRIAAQSRQTQIAQAQSAVKTAQANLAQARAQIAQPEADVRLAEVEYQRRKKLFENGDISQQSLDQAINALQNAQARLDAARKAADAAQSRVDEARSNVATANENYRQSLAQVDVTRSQVDESQGRLQQANSAPEQIDVSQSQIETAKANVATAEAAVHQAELELSYTKIYAPEDGIITKKSVQEGQLAQVGSPMMAISLSDDIWVVANFKETQLELMQEGQKVDIKVDAYPNMTFHGKVASFQSGTGSKFSLLPSENATGNYVKVVQRIPVKIVFEEQTDQVKQLKLGMSVEPTVKVR